MNKNIRIILEHQYGILRERLAWRMGYLGEMRTSLKALEKEVEELDQMVSDLKNELWPSV